MNWWSWGNFSGCDIFQSFDALKQTGNDNVLSAELDGYTSTDCCDGKLQSPCFQIFRLSIIFMFYDTDTTAEERKLKD